MFGNPFNFGQYPGIYGGGYGGGFFQPSFGLMGQQSSLGTPTGAQNPTPTPAAPPTPPMFPPVLHPGFPGTGAPNTNYAPPPLGGVTSAPGAMYGGPTAQPSPAGTPNLPPGAMPMPRTPSIPGMMPTPKVGVPNVPGGSVGDIYRAELQGNPMVNGQQQYSNQQINQFGPGGSSYNPMQSRFANMAPGQIMQNMARFATPQDYMRHFNFNPAAAAKLPTSWQGLLGQVR